jgi:nitrile hydratase subunit beta
MTARFDIGAPVHVRAAYPPGHVRTPYYCRGKNGVVVRMCGEFRNPEELAYGVYDGAVSPMYRVRFFQTDLWDDYDGSPEDLVEIEIFEHWLEPVG